MKKMMNLGILVAAILSLTSCAKRFSNTVYNDHPINNKTIAVLPYQVVTTGRLPEELTDEMLYEIESAESRAFQASFYHQILNRLGQRKYQHLNVKVQAFDESNRILANADIGVVESWDMPSSELAKLLGVDAVVRSSVHKTQYLTQLESYGIYLANNIFILLADRSFWFLPSPKSSDVRISTTIVDAVDGNAIWSASRKCPTDWNENTYDVIERINYNITRRLPR